VDSLEHLAGVAEEWDALALASRTRLPTASHAWLAGHLEHKRAHDDPWRVFLAQDADGRLRGVLPVVATPHRLLGRGRPRLRVPCAFQTDDGDVLLDPSADPSTLDALLRAVAAWAPRRFSLEIGGVRPESPTLAARAQVRWPGLVIDEHDVDGRHLPRAALHDVESRLGANFRRNLRKASNRLERTPGATIRFLDGSDAGADVLSDFLALEASGWKGRAGTALATTAASVAFYRSFVERARRRGWLEWHLLSIEGRLAAAHLAVRFGPLPRADPHRVRRGVLATLARQRALPRDARTCARRPDGGGRGLPDGHAVARQLGDGASPVPALTRLRAPPRGPGPRMAARPRTPPPQANANGVENAWGRADRRAELGCVRTGSRPVGAARRIRARQRPNPRPARNHERRRRRSRTPAARVTCRGC
jgi:hypothetical protein